AFLVASAGARYHLGFLPGMLRGIFAGAEIGYGIPMITNLGGGSARSLDLGTYAIGMLSFGYQYRLNKSVSFEGGIKLVVMPTRYLMLGSILYAGASYHL
ncbi:MAG: hypothetical protein NZL89_05155, partial [Leptospiraceae bacterium]|nr:hypothetical protein [Leptospiraceae bacterium]